jgi:Zinc-binding dehydrogenase
MEPSGLGVLAARQLGAERAIIMSRHEARQVLALGFGATDVVSERGDEGVARIKELTTGLGTHSVIEAVGTQESMMQAVRSARPGGHVGYVGVAHGVELPGQELFYSHTHLHGGPAPSVGSCHISSSSSGSAGSTPAGCSTSISRSTKSPRTTGPWTNGVPSKPCSGPKRRTRRNHKWNCRAKAHDQGAGRLVHRRRLG